MTLPTSLPTSPTSVTQTIPSYLYFQYIDDQDLPALINAYNTITQQYVDSFNAINLPIYTGLSGKLLDWVGQGVYGLLRPALGTSSFGGLIGQIASVPYHGDGSVATPPTPIVAGGLATTQEYVTSSVYDTPDDAYKRVLTWWFYKGDGFTFSIPWLKQRIARFLFGINGTDVSMPFTPTISVTFDDTTAFEPTCNIVITSAATNLTISNYFKAAIESGVLSLPFRFKYSVTVTP